jgi:hypothetical protein
MISALSDSNRGMVTGIYSPGYIESYTASLTYVSTFKVSGSD